MPYVLPESHQRQVCAFHFIGGVCFQSVNSSDACQFYQRVYSNFLGALADGIGHPFQFYFRFPLPLRLPNIYMRMDKAGNFSDHDATPERQSEEALLLNDDETKTRGAVHPSIYGLILHLISLSPGVLIGVSATTIEKSRDRKSASFWRESEFG